MEAAAGIYTRIMFPEKVSEADPHLSDLQKAMLDTTPDCIKVVSVAGNLLTMNRAGCVALNVLPDSGFGMPWLPLLPDDVQVAGAEALQKAVAGQAARFQGRSHSPAGTMYWDNLLTPLVDDAGHALSILCVSRDITEKTLIERKLEDAVDRERLLAREMRHRINNVFSIVSGLITIADKEAVSAGTQSATKILREKLSALSRASDAVFEQGRGRGQGADRIDVAALVTSVLRPYGGHCTAVGNVAFINRDSITTLALFLHELATNSVKYGALSAAAGRVTVRWTLNDNVLDLAWIESGGPQIVTPPTRLGFGTEMVDRVVQSTKGTIKRTWHTDGLVVDLCFPTPVAS